MTARHLHQLPEDASDEVPLLRGQEEAGRNPGRAAAAAAAGAEGGRARSSSSDGTAGSSGSGKDLEVVVAEAGGRERKPWDPAGKEGEDQYEKGVVEGLQEEGQEEEEEEPTLPPHWTMKQLASFVWAESRAALRPSLIWSFLKLGVPGGR